MDSYRYRVLLSYAVVKMSVERNRAQQRRKMRSCWIKEGLQQRGSRSYMTLLQEIRENNRNDFRNFFRMDDVTFQELLCLVTPYIAKRDAKFRMAISAEERLVATLRYLATGRSFEDLKFGTRISAQALGHIIPETCKAIIKVLQYKYCKCKKKTGIFGMNQDVESVMTPISCGNGKLRQWLIDQIDSGKYPGLVWENEDRTIFRIPWKHAGKQDYNRDEDAALFKAWALFKGKYREGLDKPDPPTWKTRLRCALNKSNDFEELVERSQLDISDPYKVYKIVPEGSKKGIKQHGTEDNQLIVNHPFALPQAYTSLQPHAQVPHFMMPHERSWRDYEQPHPDLPYQCTTVPLTARSHLWQNTSCDNSYQVTGSFYACPPSESQTAGLPIEPSLRSGEAIALSDCRLHISLFYRDTLVGERTTSSPEGCRISNGQCLEINRMDQILFPYPEDNSLRKNIEKLLSHLERGVILWMAHDGIYAKRLCQSRIYWEGPLSIYNDRPNKLERDVPCKLFDTQQFLTELQAFAHHGRPVPRFQIILCFGEEFPDPQRGRKLITAHVEPLFARQLIGFAEQNGGHFMRGYEYSDLISSSEDYHRPIRHVPLQE